MSIIRYASSDSIGTASLCSQGSIGKRTGVEVHACMGESGGKPWEVYKKNLCCVFLLSMLLSSWSNENTRVRSMTSFRQPFVYTISQDSCILHIAVDR